MSSQKKRLFFLFMAASGVALVVDRFVLSDGVTKPSTAVADVGSTTVTPNAVSPLEGKSTLPIPELPFPQGLKPFDAQSVVRDLFAPPQPKVGSELDASTAGKSGPDVDPRTGRPRLRSATFQARYRVNGILLRQRLKIAVVDGTWMRIGQSTDGCTLIEISGNEARFECYDGQAVLRVTDAETFSGQD